MAGSILIDEIHLTIRIPKRLPNPDAAAIQRILRSERFQHSLREAIRKLFRQFRGLGKARFAISR
jgi:hypothetical protein